jgi:tetratricopeptide (TPR) repeat protein
MYDSASTAAARRAWELYERGFCRAAIDVLEVELTAKPEAGDLWRLRAILLQRQERRDEAFDNIQRALVLAPLGIEGMMVLADGYARTGRRTSAASIYTELAADECFPLELWESLYAGLCSVGSWQAALAFCRRMARERPDEDRVYFATAHALARLSRPDSLSLTMLRKAIDLNPDEPNYRAALVIQLMNMGHADEAYRTLAEMSPGTLGTLSCRCCLQKLLQLCIERGDAREAGRLASQLATLADAKSSASATEGLR